MKNTQKKKKYKLKKLQALLSADIEVQISLSEPNFMIF